MLQQGLEKALYLLHVLQTVAAQNGAVQGTPVERNDSKAATAEAEMSQSAGDVGDWLGVDSGGPAPVQVTLVLGMPSPGLLPLSVLAACQECCDATPYRRYLVLCIMHLRSVKPHSQAYAEILILRCPLV